MFDVAIIGAGPAGLSAAINLKIRNKNIIWFGSDKMSNKVEASEKIANYPGMGFISGKDLNEKYRAHAALLGLELTDKMVTTVSKLKNHYMLLADNEIFEAKAVILATGVAAAKVFAGEDKLLGHGVSYCATCDGMFYKGKTIAVYCQAARFEEEAEYLADLADKVYLFVSYTDCGIDRPNVEKIDVKIKSLEGEDHLTGLVLADDTEIAADGLFCLRTAIAPGTLIPGLKTEGPHILVDREMKTSYPGCFAAGDCTGTPYQIAKAVGEGNVAAHSVLRYLAEADK